MNRTPKILILLYLMVGYVIAQFLWWAYSIYDLNAEIIALNQQLVLAEGQDAGLETDALKGKVWMILGEGSVFLTLLIVGAYYIRKFVLREQRLARQERNFLLATTHEFNSPIASVKLNLQTLATRSVSDEQKQTILSGALASTKRLELLVSNILMASRLDAGQLELLTEEIDVASLIQTMKDRYEVLAQRAGCILVLAVKQDVVMRGDRNALETVVGNLIENAIKYAPGEEIRVAARSAQEGIVIEVADQGKGIPESERDNVFRKFYRAENEETRSQKGSGLGLYLVKELVHLHGGRVALKANQPNGALFQLHFKHKAQ